MLYASLVLALPPLENSSSCNEHGQLPSPLNVRSRAGQRSSVPRSDGGISSGLARLCSWLVITTEREARAKAATTLRVASVSYTHLTLPTILLV